MSNLILMVSSLNAMELKPFKEETPTSKGEREDNIGDGGGFKYDVDELFTKACLAILLFFIFIFTKIK